jgi:response regulator NasT
MMDKDGLRIAVADDEPDMREYFTRILPRMGHEVVGVAANGRELLDVCEQSRPDLVITDIRMPEVDGIQAAEALYRRRPLPVILVSAYHDPQLIARAEADHVMAYLVKPIKQADLEPALAIARRRFEQFEHVRRQAADLREALEDRKVIERAKSLVMRQTGMDEANAFSKLQELADRKNFKLVDFAQNVITARATCASLED